MAFLPVTLVILVTGLLFMILKAIISSTVAPPNAIYVFTGIFVITWIWLVFGELRKKANYIVIDENRIVIANYLGLGPKQQYDIKDFEGFTTSLLPSRWNDYEYLFLIKDGKRIIAISEFYHKNYLDFKQYLVEKSKYLGDQPFNLLREIKDIF